MKAPPFIRALTICAIALLGACKVWTVTVRLAAVRDGGLPEVPALTRVVSQAGPNGVDVTFDPVLGAEDYRIYPLPDPADQFIRPSGEVIIRNGLYRCAGDREAPRISLDAETDPMSGSIRSIVAGPRDYAYSRTLGDATLGYVYLDPAADRIPVYTLGNPTGDNGCYFHRYQAGRIKQYTTSATDRATLVSQGWRDDGIAFYVPAVASADTHPLYAFQFDPNTPLVVAPGAELNALPAGVPTPLFDVLASPAAGTDALMRIFYTSRCPPFPSHDELAVGQARFQQVLRQGNFPLNRLHWSGLTGPTTLVVEALDVGCPFQGHFSFEHVDAHVIDPQLPYIREPWLTFDEMRAASPSGEVFLNGQHELENHPRAIARSIIQVTPTAAPTMDWFQSFDTAIPVPPRLSEQMGNVYHWYYDFPGFRANFYNAETLSMGVFQGQLWETFGDIGAGVHGFMRLTATPMADVASDSFLHVTMDVDFFTTLRRYPQIMISDQPDPVQDTMNQGITLLLQPRGDWPGGFEIERCDHVGWDPDNQCPTYDLLSTTIAPNPPRWTPAAMPSEQTGVDQPGHFDFFVSTQRLYVLLNGVPYGCIDVATGEIPAGPVSVTFGDVIHHSSVDLGLAPYGDYVYQFQRLHSFYETTRHFDNLGFASHVAAPTWNEQVIPCGTAFVPQQ